MNNTFYPYEQWAVKQVKYVLQEHCEQLLMNQVPQFWNSNIPHILGNENENLIIKKITHYII